MKTLIQTTGREAFSYWRDACGAFVRPDYFQPLGNPANFHANVSAGAICDLTFTQWDMGATICRNRGGDYMRRSDTVVLYLPERGDGDADFGAYHGKSLPCLFNPGCENTTRHPSIKQICVWLPRPVLDRRVRIPRGFTNSPALSMQGDGALLAGLVRNFVTSGPSTLSPTAASLAREHLLDLVAVAFAPLLNAAPKLGAASKLLELKLRAAVDAQLCNLDADRASICAAAGVSERHANRILAQEGTSVRRLLLERRLDKCREAIKHQPARSIGDIALACGFRDLRHFARAFSLRYGLAPSEYRNRGASIAIWDI